jgi:hypothetical protein
MSRHFAEQLMYLVAELSLGRHIVAANNLVEYLARGWPMCHSVSVWTSAPTDVARSLQEHTGGDPDMPSSTKLDAVLARLDEIRGCAIAQCV